MLYLSVYVPEGIFYESEVDFVTVHSNEYGEYGVLSGHLPIISLVELGFVKTVIKDKETYITLSGAIVEQSSNVIKVIAQEAALGKTREESDKALADFRKKRIEENRQRNIDLALAENELKKEIKKSGAGSV